MRSIILCAALTAALSGCSIFPYEEEFACKMKDNLGKCQSMQASYDEAITGVETAPPMKKASEQEDENDSPAMRRTWRDAKGNYRPPSTYTAGSTTPDQPRSQLPTETNATGYVGYRAAVYDELRQYVQQPTTPMIAPARAVRTMILPYTSTSDHNRLYMPRYVMSLVNQPRFVIGEYLYKDRASQEGVVDEARKP